MHWILIVVLFAPGHTPTMDGTQNKTVVMQEFNNKDACEWARQYIWNNAGNAFRSGICTPKGQENGKWVETR